MKEKDFLNLTNLFLNNKKNEALSLLEKIAKELKMIGNEQLSDQLKEMILKNQKIIFHDLNDKREQFVLSKTLKNQLQLLVSNLDKHIFINKILFYGPPGTGKTKFARELARILNLPIKIINYNEIIDSKLGETNKNLERLFNQYNGSNSILFFDELDGISTERTNNKDIFEMARVTTTLLKLLDGLNSKTIFIAATNLIEKIDPALTRRMDFMVNFDTYQNEDLLDILQYYKNFFNLESDKLLNKIILDPNLKEKIYPFEIMRTLKLMKMNENANFSFSNIYQNLLMEKMLFNNYEQLKNYLIENNKYYSVRDIEKIINESKFKKSNIASKRSNN